MFIFGGFQMGISEFISISINNLSPIDTFKIFMVQLGFFGPIVLIPIFLGLFIWSAKKFRLERLQNPESKRYLPRMVGFLVTAIVLIAPLVVTSIIMWGPS